METIIAILESKLLAALVPALIAIVGVWLSHKLAVSETHKAMEDFKSQLAKKVYASSKRSDMEYETFHKLGKICGDIYSVMEQLYPDKLSLHQVNSTEEATLKEVAMKIHELKIELNIHRSFIPEKILLKFEELVKIADQFFVCAEKHIDCWDDTKENKNKKEELRNIAYEKRLSFESKWKTASTCAMEYLQSKELV